MKTTGLMTGNTSANTTVSSILTHLNYFRICGVVDCDLEWSLPINTVYIIYLICETELKGIFQKSWFILLILLSINVSLNQPHIGL